MTFKITFKHSAMQPDFVGSCIKHAHTEKEAVQFLGKYSAKDKIVIDKRGSVLTILDIKQL